jgi:hypothetical protein
MLINKIDTVTFQIKFGGQTIRVWSEYMSIRIWSGPYAYGPNQARIQDFTLGAALLREGSPAGPGQRPVGGPGAKLSGGSWELENIGPLF